MNEIPAAGETFRGDDGTVSTILPANYGQDYEASDGELEEYAEYIGIDAAKEPELMWIAQEGLRAPLPDGWRACQTDENEVYYFNFQSGESLWDHPMDEHYKAKVIAERAKHRSGGGGGAGGGGGSIKAGGAAARTGTTKALTDSLFLKPAASTSVPLTVATAAADDGASAPRAPPDVSDILGLAVSSPLGPASARAGGAGAAAGPPKLKEAEAAVRKRLEEQTETQLRALRVEFGKTEDAARQRLEEAKTRLQAELDTAWERERTSTAGGGAAGGASSTTAAATQRRLQTAREVKQLEESWKSRLNDVRTRVADLQHKVEEQQQALQKSIHQPPEELRKTLEARNAAEMAQLREAARRQNDVALQRLKAEHAAEQAKAAAKAAETVAAAEKLSEGTQAQRAEERKAQNASMLAALQAALAAKQAELTAKEKAAAAASSTSSGTTAGGAGSGGSSPPQQQQVRQLSVQDKAAIAAAQAAAEAEIAAAKRANAVALTRLTEEYEARRREKEAAPRIATTSRASSALQTPTRDLSKVSSNSSFSVNAVSPAEQAKLDEEEQKLRDEAEKAARIYEEETELMVSNREAGRPLTAIPLPSAAANVSAEAVAALSRTATQAQRARDAENGRHSMAVKQLEAKHEQAVRLMKTQHEKALTAASTAFNPRAAPVLHGTAERTQAQLDTRPPDPIHGDANADTDPFTAGGHHEHVDGRTTMPDAEEQAKIVKTRLTQTREELQRRFDRELQSLQRSKEEELAGWQTQYRTTRLAAVQEAVKRLQAAKDAEVEAAKAKAKEHAAAAAVAATATAAEAATASARREAAGKAAVAAATEKLQALETQLRSAEATATHNEAAAKTAIAALEREVADLEAALLALTQEVSAAEKARDEYRAKTALVAAETAELAKKGAEAATSSTAATQQSLDSAPSMTFFISDAAASAEEDALRTRWVTLLATLRTAVQREMDAYERAVAETARLRAAAAVSPEPVSSGNGALPPTVPVPANHTFMSTSVPNAASQPQAGATAASVGYATPLQRPPLSATADYRNYPAETSVGPCPEVRLFANTPQQQQQQQQQSWMHGGGGAPVEHGYATGGQRFYDSTPLALQRGTSGHSTQRSLPSSLNYTHADDFSGLYPSTQRLQPGEASQYMQQRGTALAAGAGEEEKDDYALRLASLHQAVRERRHELQAQRRDLEQLRSEWKADMQRCRERDDKAEAQKLRVVKAVLEERAHRLNEAVLEVKAMQHDVQTDMRRYQQWVQQQQHQPQQQGEGRRFSAGSTSAAYALASEERAWEQSAHGGRYGSVPHAGSAASTPSTASVVGLLEGIVARTERLESLLRRSRHAGGDRTPSPGRDYARH